MKGNPAKLGTIQGTSGYNSALKQMIISREDAYTEENMGKTDYEAYVSELNNPDEGYKDNKVHGNWEISADGKQYRRTHDSKTGVETPDSKWQALDNDTKYEKAMSKQRWKQGNKNAGGNLNDLVRIRNTYTKGTQAWVDAQNKINKSLGSNKVYEVTVKTPKKEKKMLKKEIKNKNKVAWGKGQRNIFGVKKDKSKRNRKTWWNPWD